MKTYNEENNYRLDIRLLIEKAHLFSAWEEKHVFCFEAGYESFRNNVIWLDYDEILEMYIENIVHPSIKPSWQSDFNYSYFKSNVLPQINKLKI